MELTKFDSLKLTEKEQTLFDSGLYITEVDIDQFRVILYSLGYYHVEVYFNMYLKRIEAICQITEYREYDKYLDQITLNHLVA